ncbi:hypothetical protein [Nocardioides sp. HB32]|jgi:hypothetical protein
MRDTPWGYWRGVGRAKGVVMVAVSFNARERRLVVDGPCWATDAGAVADAIRSSAEPMRGLVIDLTRLAGLPDEVAAAVHRARCAAEAAGCGITVWTLPGSATESDLGAAARGPSLSSAS